MDHLDDLTRFDASKLVLDQLYSSSRCVLARYIKKQQQANPTMIIIPPQAEQCDCIYDFILTILNQKADQLYTDLCSDNQQERCQLNECNVLKNFRLPSKEEQNILSINVSILDNEFDITHSLPSYVHRHPSGNHQIESSNIDKQVIIIQYRI